MINQLKNCSIFKQFIVPIFIVGVLGGCCIIYFAFALEKSVVNLAKSHVSVEQKQQQLQHITSSLEKYRILTYKHLSSEQFSLMQAYANDLLDIKNNIDKQLKIIALSEDQHKDYINDRKLQLTTVFEKFLQKTQTAILLSQDFEKENAYDVLKNCDQEYLSRIYQLLDNLDRHQIDDALESREILISVAKNNLIVTIASGILGGCMVFVIAFWVTRRVTARLSNLLHWSNEIAAGNLSIKIHDDSMDEVGMLSQAMSYMATNIQSAHDELQNAKYDAEQIAENLRLYANAFDKSGEAILISDSENHIITVNSAFTHKTGYSKDEVLGKNPRILSSGQNSPETYQKLWLALEKENFWQGELWDRKKSGEIYPKWISISAIRDNQNQLKFYIASFIDITERKQAEERIEQLAHHDILTGLCNRFSLEDRMKQSLALARRDNKKIGVFFIDLDRFKQINDNLGHQTGDKLLIEVAKRLKQCVRDSDIVARIGGDEFIIVLTGLNEINQLIIIVENILKNIEQPYTINGTTLNTSPSIGISIYPDDCESVDELMKNSDTAMYHAKEQGNNNYCFFTESMHIDAQARIKIEQEMILALNEQQFELHYQPQIDTRNSEYYSVEALIRWQHPEQGMIPPDKFIPIAEETGHIYQLGKWVLEQACRQFHEWKRTGTNCCKMCVNLSVKQLQSEQLIDDVLEIMNLYDIEKGELEFEITETAAMSDPETAEQQLTMLKGLGIKFAIDDFGTGYSSLAYLKRLPIETLKLDKSFVSEIDINHNDLQISMATIALAHSLGLKVVAEGVESLEQLEILKQLKCDFLQGYYFSKPLPAEEIQPKWNNEIKLLLSS